MARLLSAIDPVAIGNPALLRVPIHLFYVIFPEEIIMLYTIAVVLLVLWLLGLVTSVTMGGFIHVLLVIAVVVVLLRVISGRKVL